MSANVRIVPVTRAAFERAAARDGAGPLERIEVQAEFSPPVPVTYEGLRQPGGHYLVRDVFISEAMSGKYVLNFRRYEPPQWPQVSFFRWLNPPPPGFYAGNA
jgi:hypothetical protein